MKFRSGEARYTWHPNPVLRTPKAERCVCMAGGVPPVLMMGLLFTRKCLLLDNLDKNVTASLHVLQIHGIKPLEQLMESSHIASR